MKKTLFLIDTPIQMFNVLEAIKEYAIEHYDVMTLDCCRADAYTQLMRLIMDLKPQHEIHVPKVVGSVAERISIYAQHLPFLRQQGYERVIFSNIRQQWQRDIVCSLPGSHIVLMDEGNATISFYHFLFSKRIFFDFPADPDQERAMLAAKTREEFGILVKQPESLELFTIFPLRPLPWLNIRKNKMTAVSRVHLSTNQEQVLILGAGVVEIKYLTADEYIYLLSKVKSLYPDKHIIYQPHRISSPELIEKINQSTGFEIMRLDQPAEQWLYQHPNPPATVVSLISTALSTCSLCFPALDIVMLDPPERIWSKVEHTHVFNITQCNNSQMLHCAIDFLRADQAIQCLKIKLME
ncbi:MAG: polysialyltransferase family glycosyltransferase [Rheinheimera sp.]